IRGWIPRSRNPAVAVGVEHLPAPSHGLLFISCFVVDLRINPANDRPDLLVEVESLAGIGIEIQVVRAVARVYERESTGFRIVESHLPRTASNREPLCKPVGRVAAPRGVLGGTNLGRQPDAPFAVERRTMRIGGIVWWVRPQVLHAPIEGWPT